MKHIIIASMLAVLLLAGCASQPGSSTEPKSEFFLVYHDDGRIYLFDDLKTYRSFLSVDETPFRWTVIGAGPKGETLVYGLAAKDKKKGQNASVVRINTGKQAVADNFYGEILHQDRFYVFSSWKDMQSYRKVGEAVFSYKEIAAGPGGKTVVYVLNKTNKKKKPVALIEAFHQHHS